MAGNDDRASAFLVTGAAGFIGSHLCERLLGDGHTVHGVDSYTRHYPRRLKEQNIAHLRAYSTFHFHVRDLVGAPLDELLSEVEAVFHLAARPGVRDSWDVFEDYAHSNILGTKQVLDGCALTGTRYIYASSSSIYGNLPVLPAVEQLAPRPISPYGVTKVMAEVMAWSYMDAHGFDAVGLRYFTVYGPRQRPDMAIARFIEAASTNQPIIIFGDGGQMRDFTYVEDIVEGTLRAAKYGRAGEVYNLASSNPVTLRHVLDLLADLLETELEVRYVEGQIGDVRDTWGDVTKAARDFGYHPQTPLRDGLAAQVAAAVGHSPAPAVPAEAD
jgi:UDP-glucuronate 4-epimerase